jgi:hypothetical protein
MVVKSIKRTYIIILSRRKWPDPTGVMLSQVIFYSENNNATTEFFKKQVFCFLYY